MELYARIKPYYEFVEYMSTMPSMTELSSISVLAKIDVNMDVLDDAKYVYSWCGLAPTCNESTNKKKSSRIAKVCAYLKPMMLQ